MFSLSLLLLVHVPLYPHVTGLLGCFSARLVDQTGTSFPPPSLLNSFPGVSLFQSEMANISPQIKASPVLHFPDSGQTTNVLLHFQMVDPDVFRLQVLHTPPLGNGKFQHFLYTLA